MHSHQVLSNSSQRLNSLRFSAKDAVQLLTTLLVFSLCLFPNLAMAASPHIYDVPQVGPPTSQTTLVGNGFDPNVTIDLYFDSTDVGVITTDSNGTFGLSLKAPTIRQNGLAIQVPKDAVPGQHTITAVERMTQLQAQVAFTVRADWAKFHFDLSNTGFNPYENVLSRDTVENLALNWQNTTASASPVVVNGVLYVGTYSDNGSALVALNASTGALLWRYPVADVIFNSAPAVANGVVYVACGQQQGPLYALNASTGALLWQYTIAGGWGSSPAVANGVVYIGSIFGTLYALNATTGALLWEDAYGSDSEFSSPAVANGIVYVGDVAATVTYTPWTPLREHSCGSTRPGSVASSPAVVNGVVFFGSYGNYFYALNATTGALLWSNLIGPVVNSTPAVANGVVYVGSYTGDVYALDAGTGALLWNSARGGVESSPAVANGVVYVGSDDYNVYALDPSTGALLWNYTMSNTVESSPAVVNGILYIVDNSGNLDAFGLPDQEMSEKFSPPERPDPARLTPDWSLLPSTAVTPPRNK